MTAFMNTAGALWLNVVRRTDSVILRRADTRGSGCHPEHGMYWATGHWILVRSWREAVNEANLLRLRLRPCPRCRPKRDYPPFRVLP